MADVQLTDTERAEVEAILLASDWPVEDCEEIAQTTAPAVERLIAARLVEQREAIAAAIEDARDLSRVGRWPFTDITGTSYWLDHEWDDAARIVREYQPGEDT